MTAFETRTLPVYVPTAEGEKLGVIGIIRPGSAIVGTETNGKVLLDYEGDIYGMFHGRFERMLMRAASHHIEHYPTVARMEVPTAWVKQVGWYTYDVRGGNFELDLEDPEAFAAWRALAAQPTTNEGEA